ncbi:MAG: class I SAM-dependent methyltransferase, partial [Chitinophagaceae bacterium]
DPYYRYKRKLFLRWLDQIDFTNKSVLEIGSGPGGNLAYLSARACKEVTGADISSNMIAIAKELLVNKNVAIIKTDGISLPFDNNHFDIVFTSTVLQHNTNEEQLALLIKDICRVANDDLIIFERIEKKISGHASNLGRPVDYYASLFSKNGFSLVDTAFLKTTASYYVCGAIRKLFNPKKKAEGEPVSKAVNILENIVLPVTKLLDKSMPGNMDLGMLRFRKTVLT